MKDIFKDQEVNLLVKKKNLHLNRFVQILFYLKNLF